MKKLIIVFMAILMVFGFISCEAEKVASNGLVDFKVSTNEVVAKSISSYDPGKDAVKSVVIKFTAVNQSSPIGESTAYEFGLINWDATNSSASTNGTWDSSKHRFLSQGQWKIEAIATTKTSGTVTEADDETLYYGFVNVYISKVNGSANVKMTPISHDGVGTLKLGFASDGSDSKVTSNTVVSSTATDQRITYTIYDITGASKATGTLSGESTLNDVTTYAQGTVSTLTQGSYIVAMVIDQKDGSSWVTSTGGSAVDVGIYKGLNTYVWGTISPSDYIHTSISTSMDIDGGIILAVDSSNKTSYSASVTYTEGSVLSVDKYLWFVDGKLDTTTTSSFAPTFDTSADQSGSGIHYGEHIIQCVAVDTTKKVKSEMKTVKIKYNFSTSKWDVI